MNAQALQTLCELRCCKACLPIFASGTRPCPMRTRCKPSYEDRSAISCPGLYDSSRRRTLTLPKFIGNARSSAWMSKGHVRVLVVRQ